MFVLTENRVFPEQQSRGIISQKLGLGVGIEIFRTAVSQRLLEI